jgi:transposase
MELTQMGNSPYSQSFRKQAVEKLLNRGGKNAEDIAKEVGVSTFSLYGWAREMAKEHRSVRRPTLSADKFETLLSFVATAESKQGEFLRSQGLTTEQIESWKKEIKLTLDSKSKKSDRVEALQSLRRIKALEKEIRRKDKVLAETTALLVLSKKAEALWGTISDEA